MSRLSGSLPIGGRQTPIGDRRCLVAISDYHLPPSILVGFVLTGVVTTLLGPILPVVSFKWTLSDARAGYLFTAQFLGSSLGTLVAGFFIARLGYGRLLAAGFGAMALGVGALGLMSWPVCVVAVAVYGVALGLTIPAINFFVAETNPEGPAAALNILNAAWSIGAVVSPPLVALLIVPGARIGRLVGLAAIAGIVALGMATLRRDASFREVELSSAGGGAPVQSVTAISSAGRFDARDWLRAHGLMFAVLFFLYVGIENSVGGWMATYAHRLTRMPGTSWELAPSLFWAALIPGRILAPAILRYISETKLVAVGLLLTILGVTALLISRTLMNVFCSAFLAGLGLSSVFPITIAMLKQSFGASAPPAASLMFTFAGLGGACLPWLVGLISSQYDSLRVGFLIPLVAAAVMLTLQGPARQAIAHSGK